MSKWWSKNNPDYATGKVKQVTFEQGESEGIDIPDERNHTILNKTWEDVRPKLAAQGIPPAEWFIEYKKDYSEFKNEFQDGDELWTFYKNYGCLADRAGLVIIRNGNYHASLIVWLS